MIINRKIYEINNKKAEKEIMSIVQILTMMKSQFVTFICTHPASNINGKRIIFFF